MYMCLLRTVSIVQKEELKQSGPLELDWNVPVLQYRNSTL